MKEATIYTYTADITRPACYCCGSPVEQTTNNPLTPWQGECRQGHKATYQLDIEDEAGF